MEENPATRTLLDQGQGLKATGFAKAVMEAYDFSDVGSICDIGGGQGAFLIQLLVMGGGCERSEDEYKALLGSAGLMVSTVIPTNGGPVLLECIKGK
jgi:O-methyltransferase domain